MGGATEFGFDIDVGDVGGSLELICADAASPMPHTTPAAIDPQTVIDKRSHTIVLLGRAVSIAGSFEPGIASGYRLSTLAGLSPLPTRMLRQPSDIRLGGGLPCVSSSAPAPQSPGPVLEPCSAAVCRSC